MLQLTSMNCSPIKPQKHQDFGNREVLTAATEWMEGIDKDNLSEENFTNLSNVTDKMHDGPLKTFLTITAIGGAAFLAAQKGSSKVINKVTSNQTIQTKVALPFTRFVATCMDAAKNNLKNSKYCNENVKGFKAFFVKTMLNGIESLEKYGRTGAADLAKSINTQMKELSATVAGAKGKEKDKIKDAINVLKARRQLVQTENLIQKLTTNTAAAGAGTIAVVEANKDSDKNGIADIGEHEV